MCFKHRSSQSLTDIPRTGLFIGLTVLLASSSGVALACESNHPDAELARAANSTIAKPLRVVYFHSPTCEGCREVKQALPEIINRWGSRIRLEQRSIEDMAAFNELFKYEEHYGAKINNAPPLIFVGSQCGREVRCAGQLPRPPSCSLQTQHGSAICWVGCAGDGDGVKMYLPEGTSEVC